MERREAPGRFIDPRPTPRIHPRPMSAMVGSPTHSHGARLPYHPVGRHVGPHTVLIQVFVADHLARNITRRNAAGFPPLAVHAPLVEHVRARRRIDFLRNGVHSRQTRALPRPYREGRASTGHFGLSAAHRHYGDVVIAIRLDAIVPGAQQRDRHVGSIYFDALVLPQVADENVDRALGQAELRDLVVQVQNRHRRPGIHANRGRPHMQLGLRAGIGPQMVACGQGIVECRRSPLFHTARPE